MHQYQFPENPYEYSCSTPYKQFDRAMNKIKRWVKTTPYDLELHIKDAYHASRSPGFRAGISEFAKLNNLSYMWEDDKPANKITVYLLHDPDYTVPAGITFVKYLADAVEDSLDYVASYEECTIDEKLWTTIVEMILHARPDNS